MAGPLQHAAVLLALGSEVRQLELLEVDEPPWTGPQWSVMVSPTTTLKPAEQFWCLQGSTGRCIPFLHSILPQGKGSQLVRYRRQGRQHRLGLLCQLGHRWFLGAILWHAAWLCGLSIEAPGAEARALPEALGAGLS